MLFFRLCVRWRALRSDRNEQRVAEGGECSSPSDVQRCERREQSAARRYHTLPMGGSARPSERVLQVSHLPTSSFEVLPHHSRPRHHLPAPRVPPEHVCPLRGLPQATSHIADHRMSRIKPRGVVGVLNCTFKGRPARFTRCGISPEMPASTSLLWSSSKAAIARVGRACRAAIRKLWSCARRSEALRNKDKHKTLYGISPLQKK